jgi:hypothetical protein
MTGTLSFESDVCGTDAADVDVSLKGDAAGRADVSW